MMQYWVNFASTGNPNGDGLPRWESYNSNADQWMEFGDDVSMTTVSKREKYELVMSGIDRQLAQ